MLSKQLASIPRKCPFSRQLATQSHSKPQLADSRLTFNSRDDWYEFRRERSGRKDLLDYLSAYGSNQTKENSWRIRDQKPVSDATISALLAAGAHFGHSSSRMNPNFTPYAYGVRAGITVIDLDHTLPLLRRAAQLVRDIASKGGKIIFVGTRPDLSPIVHKAAERLSHVGFYVADRWQPGLLTNRVKIFSLQKANQHEILPDLVIFLNPLSNMTAIAECAKVHVPTIGIIDSNADPRIVMYPIPANDESTRAAELIAGVLSVAGREGTLLQKERTFQDKEIELEETRLITKGLAKAEEALDQDLLAREMAEEEEEFEEEEEEEEEEEAKDGEADIRRG